ncbi:hypothetical protein EVAR_57057_1 [Eumeta japonica]|uniref:Uncharacterized protein n=1 Tax=Eumeta variegata TaxID=151549 RepID=A0A4C1YS27_EUMVA|nr:hypothetical protein EVAR_57057_1 [Eumeta japonica]
MVQFTEELHVDSVTSLTPTHYPSNDNHRPNILDIALMREKVSIELEETDVPTLNRILNDIVSTDDVDKAIGALTNHVKIVIENSL